MMMTDPLFLITFFGGLVIAFVAARGVRRLIERRRARRVATGPDKRSRQVRRAQKREARKRQKW
jgi:hypothetical protein